MVSFVTEAQAQAHTEASHGAPSGAHGAFPPFAGETFASQLLWFAIAFGLLYYVMSRIALPRIGAVMENRSQRIAGDLAEAERLRAESEARRKALEAELHERLVVAETTIGARTAEAMGSVRGIAADTATAIVERLTGQAPDRRAVEAALDRTMAG